MKAIVLCAGYATRLGELTKNMPKPLLRVRNQTLLDLLVDNLQEIDAIDEIVIVSNAKFFKNFKDWAKTRESNAPIVVLNDGSTSNDNRLGAIGDIKFAMKDFDIRRIYHNMLSVNSPYNTYKNTGLPPGPIRIPTVAGIDAVLNHVHHNYLYMCAKEDFSGTHNFAETYSEHLENAAKYSEALNKRGIK